MTIPAKQFEELVNENRKRIGLSPQIMTSTGMAKDLSEKLNFDGERFNVEVVERDLNEEIIKDINKKLFQVKDLMNFDPKKQKFYAAETGKLLIKEIDELLDDYKRLCNIHSEMCKKVEDINKVIEEKTQNEKKKNFKGIWKMFKF